MLNDAHLASKEKVLETVKEAELFFRTNVNSVQSPSVLWGAFKAVMRGHFISRAARTKREKAQLMNTLEREYSAASQAFKTTGSVTNRRRLEKARVELNSLQMQEAERRYKWSAQRYYTLANKPNTLLASQLRCQAKSHPSIKLRVKDGQVTSNPCKILEEFRQGLAKLYETHKGSDRGAMKKYLDSVILPQLDSDWAEYVDADITVDGQRVQLGIYENSFDDQYFGCLDEMESLVPELLEAERRVNKDLDAAWQNASQLWMTRKMSIKSLPLGFEDEYGIALLVYSNMEVPVYRQLNQAVREYGANPQSFTFHGLHFYLTRALSLLRPNCDEKPWHTYRGANRIVFDPPPDSDDPIRFSQFASSSADVKEAQQFGTATFFNITTCYGADIENFSYFPNQKEVLIPVDEVFQIAKHIEQGNKFVLQSTNKRCSFYNCAYLGASFPLQSSNAVTLPLVVVLGIVFRSFVNDSMY
ncbi:T-cell ecto-ADP-ribosyltransferase 1-like [Gastrophryne carolinensis]